MSGLGKEKKGTWLAATIEGKRAEVNDPCGHVMASVGCRVLVCDDCLMRRAEATRKDRDDWRKGVALIASAAGYKDGLSCVDIAEAVLDLRAKLEQANSLLSRCGALRQQEFCLMEKHASFMVAVDEWATAFDMAGEGPDIDLDALWDKVATTRAALSPPAVSACYATAIGKE